jgi:hypothetical protein
MQKAYLLQRSLEIFGRRKVSYTMGLARGHLARDVNNAFYLLVTRRFTNTINQHNPQPTQSTMSSSEGEEFNMDVSGSESNYESEPTLKKVGRLFLTHSTVQSSFQQVKMVPKPVKSKASVPKAKPKTASKKKVLVDHDENAEDSPMNDIGGEDASDNDQLGASVQAVVPAKMKKTASETYTKVVYSLTTLV